MALFRHQVFYVQGAGRPWTNVYHVDAADLVTAATTAFSILAPPLVTLLSDTCQLVKIITSTPGTPGAFINTPIGNAGGSSLGDLPTFFNTARVLFSVGSGRLDSKFLRGVLSESSMTNGLLTPTAISVLATAFGSLITAMSGASTPLVDTDLHLWETATVQQAVQMRQLHRKRRAGP